MRRLDSTKLFQIIVVFSDAVGLTVAFVTAYWIRFETPLADVTSDSGSLSRYSVLGVFSVAGSLMVFARQGQYSFRRYAQGLREYILLFQGLVYVLLGVTVLSFLLGGPPAASRTWTAVWLIAALITLGLQRFGLRRLAGYLRSHQIMRSRVAIAGANDQGLAMARQLDSMSSIEFLGFLDDFLPAGTKLPRGYVILGSTGHFDRLSVEYRLNEIIFVPGAVSWEATRDLMASFLGSGSRRSGTYDITIAPGQYELASLQGHFMSIGNIPVIQFRGSSLPVADMYLKRSIDLLVSSTCLVVASPIFFWFLVRSILTGKSAFRHIRLASSCANVVKMRVFNAGHVSGPSEVPSGWYRLPALISVLTGSMSLVGPRPRPVDLIEDRPENEWQHPLKPGAIGIVPFRSRGITEEQWSQLEIFYCRNYSMWIDFAAVLRALKSSIWGAGQFIPKANLVARAPLIKSEVENTEIRENDA